MIQKKRVPISTIIMVLVINLTAIQTVSFAQQKLRIGTYDSRAVAIAYFNSAYGKQMQEIMMKLQQDNAKAIAEKDSIKTKKLNREGQLRQAFLHEQGFGTGSVNNLLTNIKEKLDKFAQDEKLNAIVSKWELNYSDINVEIVDVTEQVANLFEPNKKFKDILKELLKNEPIKDAYLLND